MALNVQIYLCINVEWIPVLTIPTTELSRLATKPLKWLRFVSSMIYGREGFLYVDLDGVEVSDYDSTSLRGSYYFWAKEPPRFIDVDSKGCSATPTPAYFPHESSVFRDAIAARDKHCVFSDFRGELCFALHIIPLHKGDDYFRLVVDQRLETDSDSEGLKNKMTGWSITSHSLEDVISGNVNHEALPTEGVECIRNGLLLNPNLHKLIEVSYAALLRTPNFALSSDDIPRLPDSPSSETDGCRLTLQILEPGVDLRCTLSQHNADARTPETLDDWPPASVVNVAYCSAVLRKWGSPVFVEHVNVLERERCCDVSEVGF
ncbi:hypothetical protein Hypma_008265 [Hypsizygus marmoreus]|uniref:HNH nuclease domain-containing protein n=1 Tax=Hypsizygus marmoreus TaxID=39966 RepID=A0A369JTT4_HYPMA|nr:hypothetical protein Hypma_008265 [Hypsizygus marmoreus]